MAKKSAKSKAKSTKKDGKAKKIDLTKALDLTAAKPLYESLQIVRGEALVICAKNVERLGAQCLQVLLAASKAWSREGHGFKIINSSDGFNADLKTFGLDIDVFTTTENA